MNEPDDDADMRREAAREAWLARTQLDCNHVELDHGICCDCGLDMTDDLIARAEMRADEAEDR